MKTYARCFAATTPVGQLAWNTYQNTTPGRRFCNASQYHDESLDNGKYTQPTLRSLRPDGVDAPVPVSSGRVSWRAAHTRMCNSKSKRLDGSTTRLHDFNPPPACPARHLLATLRSNAGTADYVTERHAEVQLNEIVCGSSAENCMFA